MRRGEGHSSRKVFCWSRVSLPEKALRRRFKGEVYGWLRRQSWLYDRSHDSMRWQYRQAAHVLLRQGSRIRWVAGSAQIGTGPARLNLGSGRSSLSGWINCDLNPFASPDIWVDLRDRWPLRDESVEAIYIRHCLEHFDESDGLRFLKQCGRVLRNGGAIRIGVPSLEAAITEYLTGDFGFAAWLADAQSIGRRFNRYMLDVGAHHSMYDFSY